MALWPQISIEVDNKYNHCFGCGLDNPAGLKLEFQWDGKTATAEFTPGEIYQGWPGKVHGGILMCLLDEAIGYAARFHGVNCVTASMQTRFKQMVPVGEPLIIRSSLKKKNRKLVEAKAEIFLKDGTQVAEGVAKQFVVNIDNETKKLRTDDK